MSDGHVLKALKHLKAIKGETGRKYPPRHHNRNRKGRFYAALTLARIIAAC